MSKSGDSAYVRNFKRRINKKLDDVLEDANYITSTLHELTTKLQRKTEHVLQDASPSVYQELYNELEDVSEKLFSALNIIAPLCEETVDNRNGTEKEEIVELCAANDEQNSTQVSNEVEENFSNYRSDRQGISDLATEEKDTRKESGVFSKQSDDSFADEHLSNQNLRSEELSSQTLVKNYDFCNVQSDPEPHLYGRLPHGILSDSSYYSVSSFSNQENCNSALNADKRLCHRTSSSDFCSASNSSVHLASAVTSSKNYDGFALNPSQEMIAIPGPDVEIGATYKSVIVTNVNSPSEFWVQLNNPNEARILFDMKKSAFESVNPSQLQRMTYFLVPSKHSCKYQRARLVNLTSDGAGMDPVVAEVHFVDFGYTEIVHSSDLRVLPQSLSNYSAQAVCCSLYGVKPVDGEWSECAIREFRNTLEYSDLELTVIAKCSDTFLVSMNVTMHLPDGKEEYSVADMLNLMGFALSPQPSDKYSETQFIEKAATDDVQQPVCVEENLCGDHLDYCYDQGIAERHHEVNRAYDAPYYEETGCVSSSNEPWNTSAECSNIYQSQNKPVEHQTIHISSVSSITSSSPGNSRDASHCDLIHPASEIIPRISKIDSPFDWYISIPDAKPTYVQQDIMLVNVSAVLNPSHFYVNVVSESVAELDDLREQVTAFYSQCYQNAQYLQIFHLGIDGVEPGMFCCCLYPEDGCWYRARVEEVLHSEDQDLHEKVLIQYVDYGNKTIVGVDELRPLIPKFANYPAFAVPCSLAGILPKLSESYSGDYNENITLARGGWDSRAIRRFEALTTREKCFSAEVVGDKRLPNGRLAFDVVLWDIIDGKDYMINDILIDEGYAHLDVSFLPKNVSEVDHSGSAEALNSWDPMAEDYYSVLNSYGVDITDIETQTLGYKANDEKKICKFFSNNGRCYRGDSCPYQHVHVNCGGETLDQEHVFLNDNPVPLPKPGTYCLAQVTCVIDPGHFYLAFPYGTDGVIDDPDSVEAYRKEFELLQEALRDSYSNAAFDEKTTVALANGTIVVVRSKFDGHWCRARVIDVEDIDKPVEVFYVDFGGTEVVARKDIRQIKPEFLYCPFQAVECFLADVAPIERKWTADAKSTFIGLVKSKILLAHVKDRIGTALHVFLQGTSKPNDSLTVNDALVEYGLARFASLGDIFHASTSDGRENGASCNFNLLTQPG